jgi:hypothetical protein
MKPKLLLLATALLLAIHVREVDWRHFAAAFVLIDLIGYLPGALAQRRAGRRPIAPLYHHLYNFTHNHWTLAAAALAWAALYRAEWAMLALPLHLFGDRGLLGNYRKPVGRLFEEVRA